MSNFSPNFVKPKSEKDMTVSISKNKKSEGKSISDFEPKRKKRRSKLMHDFLSSTKKKNTIDRYLQKDKEKGSALITPQKEKMRVTFKIEPGKIKVEDSSKPSALETASVTKTVSHTACG